ncbi:MAG: hypothetical protein JWP70_1471 [Leifsonia sp.]|nr:hypothetical protein [Leifsonia sp.]
MNAPYPTSLNALQQSCRNRQDGFSYDRFSWDSVKLNVISQLADEAALWKWCPQ